MSEHASQAVLGGAAKREHAGTLRHAPRASPSLVRTEHSSTLGHEAPVVAGRQVRRALGVVFERPAGATMRVSSSCATHVRAR